MSVNIWQRWNEALAERLAASGLDVRDQAEKLALAVDKARGRDDRQALWAVLNALCEMQLASRRVAEAKVLAEEALALAGELFGESSPEAGTVISDLIFIEALLGHMERAHPLVQRLISIIMSQAGQEFDQAFSYNLSSLATFFTVQGADDQAEKLLWRVIKHGEEDASADPDLLLFVYDNLANFYLAKDEAEKSREAREKALKVMERAGYPTAGQNAQARPGKPGSTAIH